MSRSDIKTIKTEASANKAELLQNVVLSILANTNWIKTDLLSLVELIQDELGKVVKATDFCIGLQSENKELLDLYFVSGNKEEKSDHKQRPFGKGMADYVIKKGKGLFLNHDEIKELINIHELKHVNIIPTSWILVPLKSKGRTVGVLALRSYDDYAYTDEDFQSVKFVATQVSNVIERQLIQQELLRSEDYYRSITENATDIVIVLNAEGNIQYSSQSINSILGYKPYNLLGKYLSNFVKNPVEVIEMLIGNTDAHGPDVNLKEFKFKHKNGEWIDLEATTNNLLNYKNVNGIVINARNITERKQMEASLIKACVDTQEQERTRFAKDLHDGLGQVLTAAKINLNIAEEELKIGGGTKGQKIFDTIHRLLKQAIADTKTISHNITPHHLMDLGLVDTLKDLSSKIGEATRAEIKFESNLKKSGFSAEIDISLYRIVQELYNNSLKHGEANKISLELSADKDNVRIKYSDNGKGFNYAAASQKLNGIGLKNINTRVKALSGEISFDSEENFGFRATLTVPLTCKL
ncbi:MAG: PAS domain S-box protein [Flavobacteriales bacterium]|nr:PAS domain S-box protein [Flavobacteriales bacterium]